MTTQEVMLPDVVDKLQQGDIEVEISTSKHNMLYNPLYDHDYISSTPKSKGRSARQRFTNLTAIFNCKICGYTTLSKKTMSKHSDTHKTIGSNTKYIPCTSCSVKRLPDSYYKCSQCSYFTRNKSSLKVHEKIHGNGRPYKCTECDYSGKDLKDLIQHYECSRTLQCEFCEYSTHFKARYLTHKRKHSPGRPLVCGVCFCVSRNKSDLLIHMREHRTEAN